MPETPRPFVDHWTHGDHLRYQPHEPRLHWYVLPPTSIWPVVEQVQTLVDGPTLRPVPSAWLHCTVIQLVPGRDVDLGEREALLRAGQSAVRDLSPFYLDGYGVAGGQGATWILEPFDEITEVHRRIVDASLPYLSAPKPERYTPHITMSYSHGEGDSGPAVEALRTAPRLPQFRVDRVWLLDVQREPGPEKGWYSWEIVGEAHLNGG